MNKHPIDDLFKKRFAHLEEPYPEHLWSRVHDELHGVAKNGRRGFWWLPWATVIAIMVVSGLVVWQYQSASEVSEVAMLDNAYGSDETGVDNYNQSVQEDTEDGHIDNETTTFGLSGDVGPDRSSETGQRSVEQQDEQNSDVRGFSQNNNQIKEWATNESSQLFNGSEESLVNQSGSERLTKRNETSGHRELGQNQQFADTKGEDQDATSLSSKNEGIGLTASSAIQNNVTANSSTNQLGLSQQNLITEKLPTVYQNIELLNTTTNLSRKRTITLGNYGKNAIRLKWSVTPVYAYDFVQRTIGPRNMDGLALAQYRLDHERLVNAFTAGVEVGVRWHSWSIYTGFHYAQINDRYDYTLEYSEQVINGTPVTGTIKRSIVNRYRSYELPIIAEYGWGHKKWRMGAIFGLNVGLDFQTSGEVLDESSLQAVALEDQDIYRTNLGVIPVIGMSLGYKIGYQSMLFVRPSFKYYRGSMTRDQYGVDQRLTTTSLLFGVRYEFQ